MSFYEHLNRAIYEASAPLETEAFDYIKFFQPEQIKLLQQVQRDQGGNEGSEERQRKFLRDHLSELESILDAAEPNAASSPGQVFYALLALQRRIQSSGMSASKLSNASEKERVTSLLDRAKRVLQVCASRLDQREQLAISQMSYLRGYVGASRKVEVLDGMKDHVVVKKEPKRKHGVRRKRKPSVLLFTLILLILGAGLEIGLRYHLNERARFLGVLNSPWTVPETLPFYHAMNRGYYDTWLGNLDTIRDQLPATVNINELGPVLLDGLYVGLYSLAFGLVTGMLAVVPLLLLLSLRHLFLRSPDEVENRYIDATPFPPPQREAFLKVLGRDEVFDPEYQPSQFLVFEPKVLTALDNSRKQVESYRTFSAEKLSGYVLNPLEVVDIWQKHDLVS